MDSDGRIMELLPAELRILPIPLALAALALAALDRSHSQRPHLHHVHHDAHAVSRLVWTTKWKEHGSLVDDLIAHFRVIYERFTRYFPRSANRS